MYICKRLQIDIGRITLRDCSIQNKFLYSVNTQLEQSSQIKSILPRFFCTVYRHLQVLSSLWLWVYMHVAMGGSLRKVDFGWPSQFFFKPLLYICFVYYVIYTCLQKKINKYFYNLLLYDQILNSVNGFSIIFIFIYFFPEKMFFVEFRRLDQ